MLYTQSRSAVLQFQGDLTYQACGRHPDLIFILLQMEKIMNKINVVLCWSKLKTSR